MWDLSGIEPASPALAGGFLTTGPPGKSSYPFSFNIYLFIWLCWVLVVAHGIFIAACGISHCGMQDLVPWPGIKPEPPALGAQRLNRWTTREVPKMTLNGGRQGVKKMAFFLQSPKRIPHWLKSTRRQRIREPIHPYICASQLCSWWAEERKGKSRSRMQVRTSFIIYPFLLLNFLPFLLSGENSVIIKQISFCSCEGEQSTSPQNELLWHCGFFWAEGNLDPADSGKFFFFFFFF